MKKPKILIAGYGSWAKAKENPAQAIALELGACTWACCDVVGVAMPVDTVTVSAEIDRLLTEHSPDAWIGVGVSSAANVQAEFIGINWRAFDVPDAGGKSINGAEVIEGGPPAYYATLPNSEIVEAIKAAGIPSELSFHAGTHLCNQMLYTTAHQIKARGLSTLTGFIHVPRTLANILELDDRKMNLPSMSLALSSEAVACCVETTAQALIEQLEKRA
ncbi:MAG: pyroglutamyl-peptidase I [Sulfitobacter sp.]